jgi:prepilin-type N-terminal cleavage/methylation domain-containing protein
MQDFKLFDRRRGLTLLEIVIVMVILVVVAAWSVPTIQRSFSSQKLTKSADLVRSELNRARVRAMRTGEIHAFFYQVESPNFKVAAFNNELSRVLNESLNNQSERSSNFDFGSERLPRGVVFTGGDVVEDARSLSAMADNPDAGRLRPILFYPDGSSQTASVFIRSEDQDVMQIHLRGMTGTSTISVVDTRR